MKLCGALGPVGDQIADAGAKTQPSCSSTCRPGSLARDADDQIVADEFESEQARRPKEWFDIGRNRRNHAESLRGLLMKTLHAEPRGVLRWYWELVQNSLGFMKCLGQGTFACLPDFSPVFHLSKEICHEIAG